MFFLKGNSLLIFSLFVGLSYGQNLVPNGSFEDLSDCPQNNLIPDICDFWFSPTNATPDIFNRCHIYSSDSLTICPLDTGNTSLDPWGNAVPINALGCQEPRTGDGYAGLILYNNGPPNTDWHEYMQVRLVEPLIADKIYDVSMHVSLAERIRFATDAIQVAFVEDSIQYDHEFVIDVEIDLQNIPGNIISNTDDWTELSWEYTADGTEQFIVIGNFLSGENTLIDTVVPYDIEDHGLMAYYYFDDIYVERSQTDEQNEYDIGSDISIFPNPVQDQLFLENASFDYTNIEVINTVGQIVLTAGSITSKINVSELASGYYLLRIIDESKSNTVIPFIKE